mgnify:CR=1 FL=1
MKSMSFKCVTFLHLIVVWSRNGATLYIKKNSLLMIWYLSHF